MSLSCGERCSQGSPSGIISPDRLRVADRRGVIPDQLFLVLVGPFLAWRDTVNGAGNSDLDHAVGVGAQEFDIANGRRACRDRPPRGPPQSGSDGSAIFSRMSRARRRGCAQTGRNGFSIGARQRAEPLRISCIQGGDLRRAHDRWGGETSGARMPAATVSGVSDATSPMLITPKITVLSPRPSRVLRSRLGWAASIEKIHRAPPLASRNYPQ